MAVHQSGDGAAWTNLESLDADQPHGLDYRQMNHMAKAVRKRINQEHVAFADATVGGIHKAGGSSVLGIEDGTATIVADGTLVGHGIVWDNTARLWCSTAVDGATITGDWTLVQLHPDKQWGGGDVTWTGAHEFDASVDITGAVTLGAAVIAEGSLDITGTISAYNNIDGNNGNLIVKGKTSATDGQLELHGADGVTNGGSIRIHGKTSAAQEDVILLYPAHDGTSGTIYLAAVNSNSHLRRIGDISSNGTLALSGTIKATGDVSSQQVATAWAVFDATKDNNVGDSYNIASESREAEGDYSITFTAALADANYAVLLSTLGWRDDANEPTNLACVSRKTTGCRIQSYAQGGDTKADVSGVSVMIIGG